jgi:hypothetical protein
MKKLPPLPERVDLLAPRQPATNASIANIEWLNWFRELQHRLDAQEKQIADLTERVEALEEP